MPKFRFSPFKEGLDQIFGRLERQLMEVLWGRGESSVREVLEDLDHLNCPAYSTLITVMNRLANKDLLEKKKIGKTFFYTPVYTKKELLDIVAKKVVEGISDLSLQSTIVSFVDYIADKEDKHLESLAELINEKRKADKKL